METVIKPVKSTFIITAILDYLVIDKRIIVYTFIIIADHIHFRLAGKNTYVLNDVRRSFIRYTTQKIWKELRNHHPALLAMLKMNGSD